eukprot:scaffold60456_cov28-Prasinocladus_malaysianus.AAC.1
MGCGVLTVLLTSGPLNLCQSGHGRRLGPQRSEMHRCPTTAAATLCWLESRTTGWRAGRWWPGWGCGPGPGRGQTARALSRCPGRP